MIIQVVINDYSGEENLVVIQAFIVQKSMIGEMAEWSKAPD